jgi:hypothetical protein
VTWVKLGDELSGAAEPLSDAAFRLHVEALAWSARHLLDLQVPRRHLTRFAYCDDPETAAKELVEAGWWEERGDGWYVGLRWPEWQRERSEVERERTRGLERQRRHRRHKTGDHSECRAEVCPQAAGVESTASRRDSRRLSRGPDPTRPVPEVRVRVGEEAKRPSRRDTRRDGHPDPGVTDAESAISRLTDAGRLALRLRAVEDLDGDLPDGWERDEGRPWEPLVYGRMVRIMRRDLDEDRQLQRKRKRGA